MSNLSFGDLEADYVLTEEERDATLADDSMQEIQDRVKQAQLEQAAVEAEMQAAEQAAMAPQPAAAPTPQVE